MPNTEIKEVKNTAYYSSIVEIILLSIATDVKEVLKEEGKKAVRVKQVSLRQR